jgi:RNA polymerase sigma-70 factor (ECF subfamily)
MLESARVFVRSSTEFQAAANKASKGGIIKVKPVLLPRTHPVSFQGGDQKLAVVSDWNEIDRFLQDPSEESYRGLFQVLMPRMIAYFRVRGCGREVAEDLAQEVMLAAYTRSSGLRSRALFRPWIYKIARNTFLQWLRRNSREVETVELEAALWQAESRSPDPFRMLQFSQWMAALDTDERQIMLLRYVEEMEYHDIAEVLGMPIGTVQWKIFNSKKKLARRFGAP